MSSIILSHLASSRALVSADVLASLGASAIQTVQNAGISYQAAAAAAAGVVSHHALFRKGEWHIQAPSLLAAYLCSFPALGLGVFLTNRDYSIAQCTWITLAIIASYSLALAASIVVYRLFFHQLRKFPGPTGAAISKLWHARITLKSQNHLLLEDLRVRYGDFVRTGPREITVFDPEVMVKTDGPGNKCSKTDWYDLLNPEIGITTTRNQKLHDQRRRVWLPAVSAKELKVHEQTIVAHAHKMDSLISQAADAHSVVDFSSYAYWLSFDVMGVFALSESFDMLHNEQWHHVIKMMRGAMGLMGPVSPVPWVAQIGFKYLRNRWLVKDWFGMIGWCRDRMNERVGEVDKGHDIASWVIADSRKKGTLERDGHILTGDAVVAVIAGSDTAASTMIFLFLELAKNPQKAEKLLEELQTIDMDDRDQLHALPYLNALVEETLRLHPAVPTGGYRETPPEGIQIAGRYIPGNTNIVAPRHSLGRLERCFERAHEFIPERWTTEPQMVRDRRAFQPFAQGRYSCLGKNIALTELRTVTAMLVSKYHIRLPPGDDGSVVEAEAKDHFTAVPGKLRLVFEKRVEELVQAQGWEDAAEMV